jgi:uridine kinase
VALALMKSPLLLFDLWTLRLLLGALPARRSAILALYWLNPVAFYISYVHGQLDVVVTALVLQSLLLLADRRVAASGLVMAAAALCKFHVLLVVPLVLAWIWRSEFRDRALALGGLWAVAFAGPTALGFLPHALAGAAGYATLGSPEAGRLFSARLAYGDGAAVYVGLLLVLGVVGRLVLSSWISRDGLLIGAGALFLSLLVATDPMPGWAYWPLPFVVYFHAAYPAAPRVVPVGVAAAYLAHFVLLPEGVQVGPGVPLADLSLTALQASLLASLLSLFAFALVHEATLLRRTRPLLIGIAGDSGSGKTTLAGGLVDLFGADSAAVIAGDDYHRWERGHHKWEEMTHLDPGANDLPAFARHLRELARGLSVSQAHYDHDTGRFTDPREVRPRSTLIVEGLHALYYRAVRGSLDLAVFMGTEPELRRAWKEARDVAERGHARGTSDDVARRRESDAEQHVAPQRDLADWVIAYFPVEGGFGVRHRVWNDAGVARLVAALTAAPGLSVRVDRGAGLDWLGVEVVGALSAAEVEAIAAELFPDLRRVILGASPPRWRDGLAGVNQLMAVTLLIERDASAR